MHFGSYGISRQEIMCIVATVKPVHIGTRPLSFREVVLCSEVKCSSIVTLSVSFIEKFCSILCPLLEFPLYSVTLCFLSTGCL